MVKHEARIYDAKSIIPFTPIDCKEIRTRTTKLNRLVKRLWPKNRTGHYQRFQWYRLKNPASIYMLKVNNRNTRARCEICSKLTIKRPERRH